ncbi:hypothetical protein PG985_016426 [Apiospora marii]|uniref:Uncharacterized protein n=1 Tax=Apiospora marii TaxID=335849 RepID=A0ABR1RG52_9PEZI
MQCLSQVTGSSLFNRQSCSKAGEEDTLYGALLRLESLHTESRACGYVMLSRGVFSHVGSQPMVKLG